MAVFGWGLGFYGPGFYLLALPTRVGSATAISAAATFYFLVGAALITQLPAALRRWGTRRTILSGICAVAAATAAIPAVSQIWQLYLLYALMTVGWATMSSTAIAAMVTPWFAARPGPPLSLALTGSSLGGIVIIPLLVHLRSAWGFAAGTRAVAALMLVLLLPLAWVVVARPAPAGPKQGTVSSSAAPRLSPLRTPRFWTIVGPSALALTAQVAFLNHQLSLLAPTLGAQQAAGIVSVTGLAAVGGRLCLGSFAHRANLRWTAAAVFVIQAAGLTALAAANPRDAITAYLACGLFGLGVGNLITMPALLIHDEFPAETFTQTISLSTAIGQFTYAFGPFLMAVIRDNSTSAGPALAFCIALELAAAILVRATRTRSASQI
ncbi:MAG TPA: MFS transporter [Streptosporangiaceae bacterium]|jgi:predicted MFS family arabinose efflux permease